MEIDGGLIVEERRVLGILQEVYDHYRLMEVVVEPGGGQFGAAMVSPPLLAGGRVLFKASSLDPQRSARLFAAARKIHFRFPEEAYILELPVHFEEVAEWRGFPALAFSATPLLRVTAERKDQRLIVPPTVYLKVRLSRHGIGAMEGRLSEISGGGLSVDVPAREVPFPSGEAIKAEIHAPVIREGEVYFFGEVSRRVRYRLLTQSHTARRLTLDRYGIRLADTGLQQHDALKALFAYVDRKLHDLDGGEETPTVATPAAAEPAMIAPDAAVENLLEGEEDWIAAMVGDGTISRKGATG